MKKDKYIIRLDGPHGQAVVDISSDGTNITTTPALFKNEEEAESFASKYREAGRLYVIEKYISKLQNK